MAAIKGKNTKPELLIRSLLHRKGFRFRIHDRKLPGRPDLVFPKYKAVIFVHGCFWHGHSCPLFKLPGSRRDFWQRKIAGNQNRDVRSISALKEMGYRVLTVWECSLKGISKLENDKLVKLMIKWLRSDIGEKNIPDRVAA